MEKLLPCPGAILSHQRGASSSSKWQTLTVPSEEPCRGLSGHYLMLQGKELVPCTEICSFQVSVLSYKTDAGERFFPSDEWKK